MITISRKQLILIQILSVLAMMLMFSLGSQLQKPVPVWINYILAGLILVIGIFARIYNKEKAK